MAQVMILESRRLRSGLRLARPEHYARQQVGSPVARALAPPQRGSRSLASRPRSSPTEQTGGTPCPLGRSDVARWAIPRCWRTRRRRAVRLLAEAGVERHFDRGFIWRVPRSRVPFIRPALGLTPLGCGDWGPIRSLESPRGDGVARTGKGGAAAGPATLSKLDQYSTRIEVDGSEKTP